MSSVPRTIHLKRRLADLPPDALYLEDRSGKRAFTEPLYQRQKQQEKEELEQTGESGLPKGLRKVAPDIRPADSGPPASELLGGARQPSQGSAGVNSNSAKAPRRTFKLSNAITKGEQGVHKSKRSRESRIATIVERFSQREASVPEQRSTAPDRNHETTRGQTGTISTASTTPRKRPGAGSTTGTKSEGAPLWIANPDLEANEAEQIRNDKSDHIHRLADTLHNFALEELVREPKPKLTFAPKVSPRRINKGSAKPHIVGEDMDVEMDDDSQYVYDTYILSAADAKAAGDMDDIEYGNVGFLVIEEEDQAVWESYLEDEGSDKDWNSEEEDENGKSPL